MTTETQRTLGTMANSDVRDRNKRALMSMVSVRPGASAADLSRMTSLSPQSVMRVVTELERDGLLTRGEPLDNTGLRGQPSVPLQLNPSGAYSIGCKIGWRQLHVVLCNLTGEIMGEIQQMHNFPDFDSALSSAKSSVASLTAKIPSKQRTRLLGIGLAHPTRLWNGLQYLGASPLEIDRWRQGDFAYELQRETGLEVTALNDGNAACWGQFCFMRHPRPRNMAYLNIGTFISAGLIIDHRLWEGPNGNSANLGSMAIRDADGNVITAHHAVSLAAFEALLAGMSIPRPAGDPDDWDWEKLEPATSKWIEQGAKALAQVIANTAAVVEVEIVVLDGTLPEAILDRIVTEIHSGSEIFPFQGFSWPTIVAGTLGRSATAVGAAIKPISLRHFL